MLVCFSEPNARIQADARRFDSGLEQGVTAMRQILHDLGHNIFINRIVLHCLGCAPGVHRADANAGTRDRVEHLRVAGQSGYIVDNFGSRIDRGLGDLRLGSVNREGDVGQLTQSFDDGHYASRFFFGGNGFGVGAGAFASDIENGRTVFDQSQAMGDGLIDRKELAPIGKTVRGHVDDPHDGWTLIERECGPAQLPTLGALPYRWIGWRGLRVAVESRRGSGRFSLGFVLVARFAILAIHTDILPRHFHACHNLLGQAFECFLLRGDQRLTAFGDKVRGLADGGQAVR